VGKKVGRLLRKNAWERGRKTNQKLRLGEGAVYGLGGDWQKKGLIEERYLIIRLDASGKGVHATKMGRGHKVLNPCKRGRRGKGGGLGPGGRPQHNQK